MSDNQQFRNPAIEGAPTLFQAGPGMFLPRTFNGVPAETAAYRTTAWIGTPLMGISQVIDVVGPQSTEFMQSICVNDFSNLSDTGLRHAVICNEKGQILTDGVAIRIADDRIRTYWLNPPIVYLASISDLDVHTEDMSAKEYFIQIEGEKSLEILEEAFQADLHDIKFAKHRIQDVDGMKVQVIRLGMSGNLAYEIHGPMSDFVTIYDKVWAAGQKFGAQKLGSLAYNLFNHTEAGFPNINLHYPLPWMESGEGMADWCRKNPALAFYNLSRDLRGSLGDDLEDRFMTPYDTGIGYLVKFNHDFMGREALEKIAEKPSRTVCTLEWNPESVAKVFAAEITPGGEKVDDITEILDTDMEAGFVTGKMIYRADWVLDPNGNKIGVSTGRIRSFNYNSMISLGFIAPEFAKEGTELTVVWGTPGTKQFNVKVKVAHYPYNGNDIVSNQVKDVEEIPHRF
ncbi:MAG: hypothetical protein ACOYIK_03180 [Coriobacteriales bacterium]|jgi:vanillate/3-O-methylgallate O-demethylase